jgi:type VI secretion system protein ImpL
MPFDFPTGLPGILSLTLGAILVVIAVLLLVLGALLRRSREAATYADFQGTATAPEGVEGAGPFRVADFRSSPSEGSVRESFSQSLRRLRESLPGRRPRYQLPWLLTLGQTAGGKTTLLGSTEINLPYGAPEEGIRNSSDVCRWWLFDRAVVLDVRGDLVLRLDGASSDQPAWMGLLKTLRRYRGRRPLDGVLLTIPAAELMGFEQADSRARGELARRAELLRTRLDQARRVLEIRFPVYVLVTQCDRLPGFPDLLATLDGGRSRQMFGWSNPNPPEVAYSSGWVDDAFASVTGALDRQQMLVLREGRPLAEPQSFLAFPAAVGSLQEALRIYWNQLFSDHAGGDGLPVRGLYFSGGEGFDVPAAGTPHHFAWDSELPLRSRGDTHRRVDFLPDLFGHKILAEWNLARPDESALRRRLGWRTALQAALAVALFAGPPLLWWSWSTTAHDAEVLRSRFLRPVQRSLEDARRGSLSTDQQRAHAITLLETANEVGDYTLRTPFLPASWWSPYIGEVRRTGTAAYQRVVFPALERSLEERLRDVADGPRASSVRTSIYDLDSVSEYHILKEATDQLKGLQNDVERYDRFVSGRCVASAADWLKELQGLVDDFDRDIHLNPPTSSALRYYRHVLCDVESTHGFAADGSTSERLKNRVLYLGNGMFGNLFGYHVLAVDLSVLQKQINDLARTPPPPASATQTYQELVALIDRTKQDLALPTVAWVGQETLQLGKPYKDLLSGIAFSRFLGATVSQRTSATGDQGFNGFQTQLNAYTADATGSLLAPAKGKAVQLKLAPNILGLETALNGLLAKYAQQPQGPRLTFSPPAGTYLAWNSDLLGNAVSLLNGYQSFMGQSFQGFPGFQQVVGKSTRDTVELNVLDQVATAQLYPSIPDHSTRELRENFLNIQVANLNTAAGSFNTLLQNFNKPPAVSGCAGQEGTAYCQLTSVLMAQKVSLLQQLDSLLAEQGLYAPSQANLQAWNGQGNLALTAFGAPSANGLSSYVANQRQIIQTMSGSYATPILTAVQIRDDRMVTANPAYRRWNLINSDLTDYQGKKPNNALQLLEGFISTDMSAVTQDTCLAVAPTPGACFADPTPTAQKNPPPCDFFIDHLTRLQTSVQQRCELLNMGSGEAAYTRIAGAFNSSLRGKFPFASARQAPGATPPEIKSFFAVYDAEKPKVDNLLKVISLSGQRNPASPASPWSAHTVQEVKAFLDKMKPVRDFFKPFLEPPEPVKGKPLPPKVPAYDLAVDLRPWPARETGGDQIIERKARIDQVNLLALPAPPPSATAPAAPAPAPLRWTYGTPAQVSLRWAQNGPLVPLLPIGNPNARVEERTVFYDYTDPWALLRLLVEHTPSPDDPPGSWVFQVQTEPAQPSSAPAAAPKPDAPAPKSQARVLLGITLMTPDDAQSPLTLPAFPTEAPPAGVQTASGQ